MKIENKQIAIILVSVAVILSVVGYIVKGMPLRIDGGSNEFTGYRTLYDQPPPVFSVASTDNIYKTFTTTIFIKGIGCIIKSTVLSYGFPEGVDEKLDVTKDGKIDWIEIYMAEKSFGKGSASPDWNTPFNEDRCFFVVGDTRFESPIDNANIGYKITMDDVNFTAKQFGNSNPYVYHVDCSSYDVCRADVNKDGKVDGRDIALVAKRLYPDPYPDFCMSLSDFKPSDFDLNGDGKVDGRDLASVSKAIDQKANQVKTSEATIQQIDNSTYKVTATGYDIYHVDITWDCYASP